MKIRINNLNFNISKSININTNNNINNLICNKNCTTLLKGKILYKNNIIINIFNHFLP